MTNAEPIGLPIREWLELGQTFNDRSWLNPKYFRAWHTHVIEIGPALTVVADGKTYVGGRYYLKRT